jgi:NADH-quinone oxidoreductase subunit N
LLAPEGLLAAVATLVFVVGAFCNCRRAWSWVAGLAIVAAAVLLYRQSAEALFSGPLVSDALGHYVRWLALVLGLLFVMLISRDAAAGQTPEIIGSLLLVICGLMLVSISGDLVLMFAGLELISIPTYLLLYLGRENEASQEATTKYFFLSVFSSAVLLYGFSFLYGLGGTTWLAEMAPRLASEEAAGGLRPLAVMALVLIFAGLSFRIGAVPFHFYAPDVYQGTTATNAALLSVIPKIAGLVALVRIVSLAMPGVESLGWRLALILAVLTMTLGNTLALWQDNVRRLLAYSSIAHAGYLLIGLAAAFAAGDRSQGLAADGAHAMLLYLAVYALATIGAFAVLAYLGTRERPINGVDELAGLGRSQPLAAVAMSVFMFSLAGVPPLAGFWGKLALFRSAIGVALEPSGAGGLEYWFIGLAVIGGLNAAVAATYYLRVVGTMYFRAPLGAVAVEGRGAWAAMFASALLVLAVGLSPRLLIVGASSAASAAQRRAAVAVSEETAHLELTPRRSRPVGLTPRRSPPVVAARP